MAKLFKYLKYHILISVFFLKDYLGLYSRECGYKECAECLKDYHCRATEQCTKFYCYNDQPSCPYDSKRQWLGRACRNRRYHALQLRKAERNR